MALPLYREINQARPSYSTGANAGLWYDKFFNLYGDDWTIGEEEEKSAWVKSICARPVGDAALLEQAVRRLGCMVLALGGEVRLFATDWHFVTGLGRNHPVENGFAWHHTLGVPFLPGSSVKGVTRAWAGQWLGISEDEMDRIFGPEGEDREKQVGSVIFFDALPVNPVKLVPDVMTPHYAPYYQGGFAVPPGDWFAPRPIPFLTVAADELFLFALAPRRPDDERSRTDCLLAVRWLEEALTQVGAGAKTAVGYGRFMRRAAAEYNFLATIGTMVTTNGSATPGEPARPPGPEPTGAAPAEAPTLPSQRESLILAEMRQDGFDTDENRFMACISSKWLPKLQAADTPAEDKSEISLLLREWYLRFRPEQWRKPNKKNAIKIAEIRKHLRE